MRGDLGFLPSVGDLGCVPGSQIWPGPAVGTGRLSLCVGTASVSVIFFFKRGGKRK